MEKGETERRKGKEKIEIERGLSEPKEGKEEKKKKVLRLWGSRKEKKERKREEGEMICPGGTGESDGFYRFWFYTYSTLPGLSGLGIG